MVMRIIIIIMMVMGIVGKIIIKVGSALVHNSGVCDRLGVPGKELGFSFFSAKALQYLCGVFHPPWHSFREKVQFCILLFLNKW